MTRRLIISQSGDFFFAVDAKARKREVEFSDVRKISLKDISGRGEITGVVGLYPFSYLRERVTRGPKEAILLQLRERVERFGVFRTTPEIFYKIEKTEGLVVECSVVAVESSPLNSIMEQFIDNKINLKFFIHKAIAVSYLVAESLPNDNTLVLYGDERESYVIITDKSGIRSIRNIRFDEFLPPSESTIREEIELYKDQYRQSTGFEITKVLVLGPLRKIFTSSDILPGPKQFLSTPEAVVDYPELFGAILVPHDFNMLPKTWLYWNRHLKYATKASILMLVIAVLNGTMWGYLNSEERRVKEVTNTKTKTIRVRAEELNKEIPVEKLKFVDSYNQTLEAFKREHRMDEFLARLVQIIPPGFKIIKLSVSRASSQPGGGGGGERNLPVAGSPSPGSPGNLNLILSVGAITDFYEAHRVFKHILDSLHNYYNISKSSFRFNDREETAECNFELRL